MWKHVLCTKGIVETSTMYFLQCENMYYAQRSLWKRIICTSDNVITVTVYVLLSMQKQVYSTFVDLKTSTMYFCQCKNSYMYFWQFVKGYVRTTTSTCDEKPVL